MVTLGTERTVIIYIYIYIYLITVISGTSGYLSVGIRYPDELLRRNCSRLVPDSRNNSCHYFALLSIEHFFALVA